MNDVFWLSEAQMRRIEPYVPLSYGISGVDDRRIVSGIVFAIRNGCAGATRRRTAASLLKRRRLLPAVSGASKTGDAFTPAATNAPTPSCRPSLLPPPSSSGSDQ